MKLHRAAWLVAIWIFAGAVAFSCSQPTGKNNNETRAENDGGTSAQPPANNNTFNNSKTVPDQSRPDQPAVSPDQTDPPEPRTNHDVTLPETVVEKSPSGPELEPSTPEQPVTPPERTIPPPERTTPPSERTTPPPDRAPPAVKEIRFITMGDTGTGTPKQKAVAAAIKRKCDAEAKPGGRGPCDFGILLGDNFYDTGVKSANDAQFKTKFSDAYKMLKFPFYITIGNHDYGTDGVGGLGANFKKFQYYRDYAKTDPQFVFPNSFYSFKKGNATFVNLNSCEIFFEGLPGLNLKPQRNFVRSALAKAKREKSVWTFSFSHHPYISNGTHGNAGKYEGIPFIPFVSGASVKKFFEKEICGKVDFHFAGHDHNMQLLKKKCGTNFLVHGAGAKRKKAGNTKRNPVWFQNYSDIGFTYIHIKGRSMTVQFYTEKSTKPIFEKIYTK